jgi:hypothetical protein
MMVLLSLMAKDFRCSSLPYVLRGASAETLWVEF